MVKLLTHPTALFNPEIFQGKGKKRSYFEGWYFKLVNKAETHALAIIPGVAFDKNGEGHSFIQVLDGKKKTSQYHRFPAEAFQFSPKKFEVRIEGNHFSESGLTLALPELSGSLTISETVGWPKPWYAPGIMGPFSFVPFMECYHGIVSMDHQLSGVLTHKGKEINFNGGRGYLEKDWGSSFPSAYFWMQTNHFSSPGTSLKASVAKIPWLGSSFVGFIAGFWHEGKLHRFTTYNQTKLKHSHANKDKVELGMENPSYSLNITAHRDNATELASPIKGHMDGKIEESMTATIDVVVTDKKKGEILFEDTGRNAGLEVAGAIKEIQT